MTELLLEARHICKQYDTLKANDDISLCLAAGKIHALIGENGAGKSTLVSILYGTTQADSGEILWRGQPTKIRHPVQARQLGIGIVFQKFSLFEPLTVLENIVLGIDYRGAQSDLLNDIRHINEHYELATDPHRRVADLATGEKQRVEIIRCLLQKPALLIMDEPTSVLTPAETEGLFKLLKTVANEGCAVLFISHKLDEVENLCEEMTVLRRGKMVACQRIDEVSRDEMIRLMVGKSVAPTSQRTTMADNETVLHINHLRINGSPFTLQVDNLSLRKGIITGVAGIAGNGQELLQQSLSGEIPCPQKETIALNNTPIGDWGVRQRNAGGILTVPTDRYHTASVGAMSLANNVLLSYIRREDYIQKNIINHQQLWQFTERVIKQFNIAAPDADTWADALSGGNLQKFVVGRAVLQNPLVLVVANPTWGVDIQASYFIRQAICDLRDTGAAVLVISEDLDELFSVADEIAVINSGVLFPPVPVTDTLTARDIGEKLTAGGVHHNTAALSPHQS